jgi:hypothetical protein
MNMFKLRVPAFVTGVMLGAAVAAGIASAGPVTPFADAAFGMNGCLMSLAANWAGLKGRITVDATITRDGTVIFLSGAQGPLKGRGGQFVFDVPPRPADTASHEFLATIVYRNSKGDILATPTGGPIFRDCL